MFELFKCVAMAVKEKGVRGALDSVPGGGYAFDIAGYALKLYLERRKVAALRAELEKAAAASAAEARKVAEEVARKVVGGEEGEELLWAVEEYLAHLPGALRQSLGRPADPTGTTLPAGLALDSPEAFAKLLARVPQFRGGPFEGGAPAATFVPLAAPLEPEAWFVPLRGSWFARPAGAPASAWAPVAEVPGEVLAGPGGACRLALHPDSTDDDLAQLEALAGLPGLEAIDLSGCGAVTDAGLMHLARLRGLKAVGLAGTRVTDSGVVLLLTRFPEVEELDLAGAAGVSGGAVPHLMRLRKLRSLALPPAADEAVRAEFARRRPACRLA
jgi:hypothetical protein